MHTALDVAHYILGKANIEKGDSISPLKLQKLIYYCQAWHYTLFSEAIFEEKIEAWAHGPVIRSVWENYKSFATMHQAINLSEIEIPNVSIAANTEGIIKDVISIYAEHTGSYLEALTHSESPWIEARGGLKPHEKSDKEITLDSMKKYYSTIIK